MLNRSQKLVILLVIENLLLIFIFLYFSINKPTKKATYAAICGAIKNPKVYEIIDAMQLHQLVLMAGGLKENADITNINMDQKLIPFKIYWIPYKKKVFQTIKQEKNEKKINKKVKIPIVNFKKINIIYAGLPRTYLLITLIPESNLIIVSHIPYYTLIPDSYYEKTLYEVYLTGGISFLVNSVERITGEKIDYYFTQNREQWIKFINTLGGIKVKLPLDFRKDYQIESEYYNLDGILSWEYIRYINKFFRKTDVIIGSFNRLKNQKEFIKAMYRKFEENNFFKQGKTVKILLSYSETNLKTNDLMKIFFKFKNIKNTKLELMTFPGTLKKINDRELWVVEEKYQENLKRIMAKYLGEN